MTKYNKDLITSIIKEDSATYNDFMKFNAAIDEAKELFGFTEDEAVAFVSKHWNLPDDVSVKDIDEINLLNLPKDLKQKGIKI